MKKDTRDSTESVHTQGLSTWEKIRQVVYVLVIIVLVSYLSYTFQRENRDILVSQTQHQLADRASLIAIGIETFVSTFTRNLGLLSEDPTLCEKAQRDPASTRPSTDHSLSNKYFEKHKNIIDTHYILNTKGVVVESVPPETGEVGIDLSGKPDVAYVLSKQKLRISEPFLSPYSDKVTVAVSCPLFSEGGFAGVVRCLLSVEQICSVFIHSVEVSRKGYAWVLDGNAMILGHPNPEYVGKSILALNKDGLSADDWSVFMNIAPPISLSLLW